MVSKPRFSSGSPNARNPCLYVHSFTHCQIIRKQQLLLRCVVIKAIFSIQRGEYPSWCLSDPSLLSLCGQWPDLFHVSLKEESVRQEKCPQMKVLCSVSNTGVLVSEDVLRLTQCLPWHRPGCGRVARVPE